MIYFFFLFSDLTRLGLPAGCPIRFFCAILDFFSAAVISDAVLGVFDETLFLGRQ
jgi:aminoglycoside N3'-acetyltransferase